jgi:hypothetical protein
MKKTRIAGLMTASTPSLNPEQRCLAVGIDRGRELGINLTLRFE